MPGVKQLQHALASLGPTAEDVARKLSMHGCRGRRADTWDCPVAHYLERLGFADPTVDPDEVVIYVDEWRYPLLTGVPSPSHVRFFVIRFDRGEWPELETYQ
jgi:hypothetical protein